MRKAIIAGNWKMNNTIEEAVNLVKELKPLVNDASCDVVVCPTFLSLPAILWLGLKTCILKSQVLLQEKFLH